MTALALIGALILGALLWLAADYKVKQAERDHAAALAAQAEKHDADTAAALAVAKCLHSEKTGRLYEDLAAAEERANGAIDSALIYQGLAAAAQLEVDIIQARYCLVPTIAGVRATTAEGGSLVASRAVLSEQGNVVPLRKSGQ